MVKVPSTPRFRLAAGEKVGRAGSLEVFPVPFRDGSAIAEEEPCCESLEVLRKKPTDDRAKVGPDAGFQAGPPAEELDLALCLEFYTADLSPCPVLKEQEMVTGIPAVPARSE